MSDVIENIFCIYLLLKFFKATKPVLIEVSA